jgi:mono/diheme cytochrome c family protein
MKLKTKPLVKTIIAAILFAGVSSGSARAHDATQLWAMNCASCHGKDGKGQTMMGRKLQIKDLTDAKVQSALTDADAAKIIKEGVTDNGAQKMKAFGDKFSDDQIKGLAAQVRSFKPAN